MRKFISLLLSAAIVLSMSACGNSPVSENVSSSPSTDSVTLEDSTETMLTSQEPSGNISQTENEENKKVLVAFFSWAFNAMEFEPGEYDVDAVGQASVVVPGDVGIIAQYIEQALDADEFVITVDYKYSSDYNVCIYEHRDQRDRGEMPDLTSWIDNLEDYDTIFLGFPNWNYGLPMPIRSFVADHDLSGKTIIPFVTHGTGGLARTIQELNGILLEDCTVLKEYDVYEDDVKGAQEEVNAWLTELGYNDLSES